MHYKVTVLMRKLKKEMLYLLNITLLCQNMYLCICVFVRSAKEMADCLKSIYKLVGITTKTPFSLCTQLVAASS